MEVIEKQQCYRIFQCVISGKWAKAQAILEQLIVRGMQRETLKDYSQPLAEIIDDTKVLNFYEVLGATTVEGFYRLDPAEVREKSEDNFTSKDGILRASKRVYSHYGMRLHRPQMSVDRISEDTIEALLEGNVINQWDVMHTEPRKLAEILHNDPRMLREVAQLQRILRG